MGKRQEIFSCLWKRKFVKNISLLLRKMVAGVKKFTIEEREKTKQENKKALSIQGECSGHQKVKAEDASPVENCSWEQKALGYAYLMNLSRDGLCRLLQQEGCSRKEILSIIDQLNIDWKRNALEQGKHFAQQMHLSKRMVYDRLTAPWGEGFSADEAQYAMEHLECDWQLNAVLKARDYQNLMRMSKEAIYQQLISEYGEKFTPAQASCAIQQLEKSDSPI